MYNIENPCDSIDSPPSLDGFAHTSRVEMPSFTLHPCENVRFDFDLFVIFRRTHRSVTFRPDAVNRDVERL